MQLLHKLYLLYSHDDGHLVSGLSVPIGTPFAKNQFRAKVRRTLQPKQKTGKGRDLIPQRWIGPGYVSYRVIAVLMVTENRNMGLEEPDVHGRFQIGIMTLTDRLEQSSSSGAYRGRPRLTYNLQK
jgi:hypothetical protein